MAAIKCKMCGGKLDIAEGMTVAECEYCGSKQTVPSADSEKKVKLFERANKLRTACEFDKAYGVYESIVAEYEEEAEAYWGLVLCKYGIEYVDDPKTGRKIPTCHRSSYESVMDDENFELAMENTDAVALQVYREEAKQIEEIRKGIIEVSMKEEPYDIFICYKETDENGERTLDSVLAQDVYDALTAKGYRAFFSRITLEDKLGVEYEPYIFAALNSARVMLAFGTKYEYYNAIWVKNEWSRFLQIMEKDREKHLIPCYKDIDAYDIPREFTKLQAQDLGKVGAEQDLLRGIEKIIGKREKEEKQENRNLEESVQNKINNLNKRGYEELVDENWQEAKKKFDDILMIDGENAKAYVGLFMIKYHLKTEKDIVKKGQKDILEGKGDIYANEQYLKNAYKNADSEYRKIMDEWKTSTKYEVAMKKKREANTAEEFVTAAKLFQELGQYKNSEEEAQNCLLTQKQIKYEEALSKKKEANTAQEFEKVAQLFLELRDYKNAKEEIRECLLMKKQIEEQKIMYKAYQDEVNRFVGSLKQIPEVKKLWEQIQWVRKYKSEIHYEHVPYTSDERLFRVACLIQAICFFKPFFENCYYLYGVSLAMSFVIWWIVIYNKSDSIVVSSLAVVAIYFVNKVQREIVLHGTNITIGIISEEKIVFFLEYIWVIVLLFTIIRFLVIYRREKINDRKRQEIRYYEDQAEQDAERIRGIWSEEYKKLMSKYSELGTLRMKENEVLVNVLEDLESLVKQIKKW